MPDDELPIRPMTVNQVVAYNIAYFRNRAGLTQEQLASQVNRYSATSWSKTTISAAERSTEGNRIRQFTADDLFSFALALRVPVTAFFLPPLHDGVGEHLVLGPEGADVGWGPGKVQPITMKTLMKHLVPFADDMEPSAVEYRARLTEAIEKYFDFGRHPDRDALLRFVDDPASVETLNYVSSQIIHTENLLRRLWDHLEQARDSRPADTAPEERS